MKYISTIAVLILCIILAGCTGTSPAAPAQAPPSAVPTTETLMKAPVPTAVPFPNALSLNEYAAFGNGNEQGKATVYGYSVKPYYDWTDPSWNSPAEQLAASQPLDLQRGYNRATPKDGNTFLFVYVRVQNTGTGTIFAPSAKQFVVSSNGKTYNYSSVHGSDVIINNVLPSQYLYQRGQRDPIEYILPGDTPVEGYLIFEIPAPFSPGTTYVVSNVNYQSQAAWKLD